jgi:hypothetical protein
MIQFDHDEVHAFVERSKRLFDAAFLAEREQWGVFLRRSRSIFILACPLRSTLVEQILASHSQI